MDDLKEFSQTCVQEFSVDEDGKVWGSEGEVCANKLENCLTQIAMGKLPYTPNIVCSEKINFPSHVSCVEHKKGTHDELPSSGQ